MSENTLTTRKPAFTTKQLVLIPLMSVLIAVCSWISVPTEIPFTLQTFAVFCSLWLLGGRNGLFSVLIYLLLGAVGIPVFAGFTGGIGIILGTTGGYMAGFIVLALIFCLAEKLPAKNNAMRIAVWITALCIGTVACYAFGTVWFMKVYASEAETISLRTALRWCVIPFIPFDLIKLVFAAFICERLRKYVSH